MPLGVSRGFAAAESTGTVGWFAARARWRKLWTPVSPRTGNGELVAAETLIRHAIAMAKRLPPREAVELHSGLRGLAEWLGYEYAAGSLARRLARLVARPRDMDELWIVLRGLRSYIMYADKGGGEAAGILASALRSLYWSRGEIERVIGEGPEAIQVYNEIALLAMLMGGIVESWGGMPVEELRATLRGIYGWVRRRVRSIAGGMGAEELVKYIVDGYRCTEEEDYMYTHEATAIGLAEALLGKHSALRRLDPENLYHALCKVLACWGPRGRPPRHWGGKIIERLGKKLVEKAAWVLRMVKPWTRGGFDNLCAQRLMWRYEEVIPPDIAEEYTRSYIEEMRKEITGFLEEENYDAIAYLELDEKPQFLVKAVTEQVIWPLLEKRINEAAQRSPREALRLINKTLRQISGLEPLAHLAELLRRKKEMIRRSIEE